MLELQYKVECIISHIEQYAYGLMIAILIFLKSSEVYIDEFSNDRSDIQTYFFSIGKIGT